jgi:hypothetical protein
MQGWHQLIFLGAARAAPNRLRANGFIVPTAGGKHQSGYPPIFPPVHGNMASEGVGELTHQGRHTHEGEVHNLWDRDDSLGGDNLAVSENAGCYFPSPSDTHTGSYRCRENESVMAGDSRAQKAPKANNLLIEQRNLPKAAAATRATETKIERHRSRATHGRHDNLGLSKGSLERTENSVTYLGRGFRPHASLSKPEAPFHKAIEPRQHSPVYSLASNS